MCYTLRRVCNWPNPTIILTLVTTLQRVLFLKYDPYLNILATRLGHMRPY